MSDVSVKQQISASFFEFYLLVPVCLNNLAEPDLQTSSAMHCDYVPPSGSSHCKNESERGIGGAGQAPLQAREDSLLAPPFPCFCAARVTHSQPRGSQQWMNEERNYCFIRSAAFIETLNLIKNFFVSLLLIRPSTPHLYAATKLINCQTSASYLAADLCSFDLLLRTRKKASSQFSGGNLLKDLFALEGGQIHSLAGDQVAFLRVTSGKLYE